MAKKNILNKQNKTNTASTKWVTPIKIEYRHSISSKIQKRLKLLERINSRLISKIKYLTTYKNDLQNIKIKYLKLKEKVLDTEVKLLLNGVDTSKYSMFYINYEEKNTERNNTDKDQQLEILSEHLMDTENQ